MESQLNLLVAEHEGLGAERRDKSLGLVEMPAGYALMINSDHTHFYWLCYDGRESSIDWDKWSVYRGAKADAKMRLERDSNLSRIPARRDADDKERTDAKC